jgi:hypothetical protein
MKPIIDLTPRAKERNNLTIKKPVRGILENITLESLRQGVNPFAPLAIAQKESGFGTISFKGHHPDVKIHNPMQVDFGRDVARERRVELDYRKNLESGDYEGALQKATIKEGVAYYKKHLDLNDGSMWHGLRNYNGAGSKARKYAGHVSELVDNLKENNPHVVDLVNKVSQSYYEGMPEVVKVKEEVNPMF